MGLSERVAGPRSREPVRSKRAPWQGHTNSPSPSEYRTRQPACGQMALNAAYRPAVGWTTYAGAPARGSLNAATPPTGTALAGPMATPPGAPPAEEPSRGLVVAVPPLGPPPGDGREAASVPPPSLPDSSRPIQAVAADAPSPQATNSPAICAWCRNVRRSSVSLTSGSAAGGVASTGQASARQEAPSR